MGVACPKLLQSYFRVAYSAALQICFYLYGVYPVSVCFQMANSCPDTMNHELTSPYFSLRVGDPTSSAVAILFLSNAGVCVCVYMLTKQSPQGKPPICCDSKGEVSPRYKGHPESETVCCPGVSWAHGNPELPTQPLPLHKQRAQQFRTTALRGGIRLWA